MLPAGTVLDDTTIVAPADLILGNQVRLGFGVRAGGRLFIGQGVDVGGPATCAGEIRMDSSSRIRGSAASGGNAYLGERCRIDGDLEVEGDMDVGDDVQVGGLLKAKGWVQKRSPVPLVMYVFLYLLELLRLGHSKEVDRILKELDEMEQESPEDILVADGFLFVPDGSRLGGERGEVNGNLDVGPHVRLLGNLTVKGNVRLGVGARVLGAVRCEGDAVLEAGSEVQGELACTGSADLADGCQVLGDLKADTVRMVTSATVDGKIVAAGGVMFRQPEQVEAQATATAKVKEFGGKAADLIDLLR
ncbi:MAG TPA: polymer-forming cytoskeletal protein [Candidatus Thermoplasmatota archaeon]|nr:polymer-forming cytoskeletal protein [Candidatus Thermoplasmatota archaeon]